MPQDLFDISGSHVLVSGGSRGIGLAIARAFSEHGARVAITGRNERTLASACETTSPGSYPMTYRICDVQDADAISECVDAVAKDWGRIDTLINCAGINNRKPAVDYSPEEYDALMSTNLRGAFFMAQVVGKQMIRQGSGNQINIDSLSTYGSLSNLAPYAMAKSGVSSMTRAMALEWGRYGVRVNALAPGFILTDLNKKLWSDNNMQAWNQSVTPLGRMGQPADLVGTAIFLSSPAAAFVTGQVIRVDGGVSAGINWPIGGDYTVTLSE